MSAKRRKRAKKSPSKSNLTQAQPTKTVDLAQTIETRETPTPAKSPASRPSPKLDRAAAIREADARQARFVAGVATLAFAVGVVFFFAGKISRRFDQPTTPGAAAISTPQKLADAVAAEVAKERSNATQRRAVVETSVKTAAASPAETLAFVVDLNSASKAELANLPRVGEKLAERIVERREELGGFRSVDDLLGVKGIGEKTLDKMRPFCVVAPLDDAE